MLRLSIFLLVVFCARMTLADVLVVCPDQFRPALQRWVKYREGQEHRITIIAPGRTGFQTRQLIKSAAEKQKFKYLVLVGDTDSGDQRDKSVTVPTDYIEAKVNVKFGSENEIATDSSFGDFDEDGFPDVAVGRISVHSVEELNQYIDRIIAYESEMNWGHWRRRIQLIGGIGGFGYLEDQVIQVATKRLITDLIPADYDVNMTYAGWRSPYFPDPRRFSETAIDRFNEGSLFWVYVGHGQKYGLDEVRTPFSRQAILDHNSVSQLNCTDGSPIALMLCCYSGAFDARQDCLAEKMMKQPRGPIATICATRVSMPYSMSVMARNMMKNCFDEKPDTIGQLFLASKRALIEEPDPNDEYRALLDGLAKWLSPSRSVLNQERVEHVHMFHLLGDPLLKLATPAPLDVKVENNVVAGQQTTITTTAPVAGTATVELVYRRDRFLYSDLGRSEFPTDPRLLGRFQETYQKANQKVCWNHRVDIDAGEQNITIPIPEGIDGECFVRVYLDTQDGHFVGSKPLHVAKRSGQNAARPTLIK